MPPIKDCLNCGMHIDSHMRHCPKCDNRLDLQTDGSTRTIDIAHQGERVRDAERKLKAELRTESAGVTKYLRVIVGSGVIREEVFGVLGDLAFQKKIIDYYLEPDNSGAILVQLKP